MLKQRSSAGVSRLSPAEGAAAGSRVSGRRRGGSAGLEVGVSPAPRAPACEVDSGGRPIAASGVGARVAPRERRRPAAATDGSWPGSRMCLTAHGRVTLAMAAQPAIVLAAAEVLDVHLRRGMLDHLAEDANALDDRLADPRVVAVLIEQHARKLDRCPGRHAVQRMLAGGPPEVHL